VARPALLERVALLPREPLVVLVPLLLAQWVSVALLATTVRHSGWLFYQGGDQTFFYTDSWVLSQLHVPESKIGYAWSLVLAPIALVYGPNVLAALPAVVLLQVLVLMPAALLAVYGIASRIGGRIMGYLAAALWAFGPYLSIPLWDQRYHEKFVEQFLPQAVGLSGLGDYPSTVFLLVAAFFVVRSLETRAAPDALVAGLVAGFAFGVKPANVLFLAGPALAYAVGRRFREALAFTVALAPALVTLTLWKYRGLGHLPLIYNPPVRAYLGAAALPLLPDPVAVASVGKYLHLDWDRMQNNLANFREFFWSVRLLEFVPLAGAIAVARRSLPTALLLAGWFGAFFLVKGTSTAASVEEGSFFRLFLPGIPPFILLLAAIPLLAPKVGPRLAERYAPGPLTPLRWRSAGVIAPAVLLAALPLLVVGISSPLRSRDAVKYFAQNVDIPVDDGFVLRAEQTPSGVLLRWNAPSASSRTFYRILRSPARRVAFADGNGGIGDPSLPFGTEGIRCLPPTGGAADCRVEMDYQGPARTTTWLDRAPLPAGRWTYRVGLAANWLDDPERGDMILLSTPATVTVQAAPEG
jgi:hypothetical protein